MKSNRGGGGGPVLKMLVVTVLLVAPLTSHAGVLHAVISKGIVPAAKWADKWVVPKGGKWLAKKSAQGVVIAAKDLARIVY